MPLTTTLIVFRLALVLVM